jgi:hypothetical protein
LRHPPHRLAWQNQESAGDWWFNTFTDDYRYRESFVGRIDKPGKK